MFVSSRQSTPTKVLVFATDELRLLLQVSYNIVERIPAEVDFLPVIKATKLN